MESEEIFINELAAKQINLAKSSNSKVCAVGTTVMRTIESSVSTKMKYCLTAGGQIFFFFRHIIFE